MISLQLAYDLKTFGFKWQPKSFDLFAIPDRDLDDRIFVISELQSGVERIQGHPMVTFHGTAEWAVDYLITSEAIWLPNGDQLRAALFAHLTDLLDEEVQKFGEAPLGEQNMAILLRSTLREHHCEIHWAGKTLTFTGDTADDAYAQALIFFLQNRAEKER